MGHLLQLEVTDGLQDKGYELFGMKYPCKPWLLDSNTLCELHRSSYTDALNSRMWYLTPLGLHASLPGIDLIFGRCYFKTLGVLEGAHQGTSQKT